MSNNSWDNPAVFFDSDWTTAAVYGTTTYSGIIYQKTSSNSVVSAGLSSDVVFSMMFQISDFATMPTVDSTIVVNSETLRIKSIRRDSTNKCFILDLQELYS